MSLGCIVSQKKRYGWYLCLVSRGDIFFVDTKQTQHHLTRATVCLDGTTKCRRSLERS